MKLLTHNLLYCNIKHCEAAKKGYAPLRLISEKFSQNTEQAFNPVFVRRMIPRLDWQLLVSTLSEVS